MQWLCNHEDQNMQRMAVAIISILAAKVCKFVCIILCAFSTLKYLVTQVFQTLNIGIELDAGAKVKFSILSHRIFASRIPLV